MESSHSNIDANEASPCEEVSHSESIIQCADLQLSHRRILIEMAVVLSFAALPDIFGAIEAWYTGQSYIVGFLTTNAYLVVRSIAVACPLFYILSLSGTSWSTFGIRRVQPFRDLALGIVVCVADLFFWIWIADVLRPEEWNVMAPEESDDAFVAISFSGAGQFLVLFVALAFNSLAEELAMRAYLIPRLEQLSSSTVAVVLSSAIFASYHLYLDVSGVISALISGLVFGVAFIVLRRLWPLVVAHTLVNLYSAVQVSFFYD